MGGNMNSEKITIWIQIAASIAVLVGLALVVVELRQTHSLTRSELGSAGFDLLLERWRSNIGENFAEARTKACVAPEKLTDVELTELKHYYLSTHASINRQKILQELGDFDNYDWASTAVYEFGELFREQPARAWFESEKEALSGVSPEIVKIGEEIIRTTPADCSARFLEFSRAARAVTNRNKGSD